MSEKSKASAAPSVNRSRANIESLAPAPAGCFIRYEENGGEYEVPCYFFAIYTAFGESEGVRSVGPLDTDAYGELEPAAWVDNYVGWRVGDMRVDRQVVR